MPKRNTTMKESKQGPTITWHPTPEMMDKIETLRNKYPFRPNKSQLMRAAVEKLLQEEGL